MRAVEKKLRQIAELKELKAGGKPLEKNQLDKIEAEAAIIQSEKAIIDGELADAHLRIVHRKQECGGLLHESWDGDWQQRWELGPSRPPPVARRPGTS